MTRPPDRRHPRPDAPRRSVWATVLVVGLLVAYVVARPHLERRFGVSLPDLIGQDEGQPRPPVGGEGPEPAPSERAPRHNSPADKTAAPDQSASSSSARGETGVASTDATQQPGQLRDLGRNVLESPAGLRYRPGSEEGHRLKHVLRHAEDDPDRPGPHGVFDGDQDAIVALLDEAYRKAQSGVRTDEEDGRSIYTVDLGRRIGYVGGRDGARQKHPPAMHVRLVLDGVDVITAFPLRP